MFAIIEIVIVFFLTVCRRTFPFFTTATRTTMNQFTSPKKKNVMINLITPIVIYSVNLILLYQPPSVQVMSSIIMEMQVV